MQAMFFASLQQVSQEQAAVRSPSAVSLQIKSYIRILLLRIPMYDCNPLEVLSNPVGSSFILSYQAVQGDYGWK